MCSPVLGGGVGGVQEYQRDGTTPSILPAFDPNSVILQSRLSAA